MPPRMSKGGVWGVAAGAAVLFVVIGAITIILWRRTKQKKKIAILAAGERRLSGYPGGHFSITDADVARMPGTKRVIYRTKGSYGSSRSYTAVTSRETLPRRPITANMSSANTQDPASMERATSSPSWPLPRRLTRSNATPLVRLKSISLTPITEKSTKRLEGIEVVPTKKVPAINEQGGKDVVKFHLPVADPQGSAQSDVVTTQILKPNPLFHAKPRSSSASAIAQLWNTQQDLTSVSVTDSSLLQGRLPRSSSLCSQQSGLAPTIPMPPLPLNLPPSKRYQSIRSPTETSSRRTSGNSLFSGDTYILDDSSSRPFSQAETDFTSTSLASAPKFGFKPEGLGIFSPEHISWNPSSFWGSSSQSQPVKVAKVSVPPGPQKPFRASIVNSLPRSESSGLSMSLLDQGPSRNTSSASLSKERALVRSKSSLRVPGNADRNVKSLREVCSGSPLRKIAVHNRTQDVKSKRVSTSILQVVSGNNGSPLHDQLDKRPSSWSTGNPFEWQPTSLQPGKPSATKGRARGHKAHDSVRILNVQQPVMPLKFPHAPGQIEHTSRNSSAITPSLDLSKKDYFLPRPPSRITFEPQISSNSERGSSHQDGGTAYSPTLSVVGLYNSETMGSPELETLTPKKKPSDERRSGANPNRHKTVFSQQNPARWSFLEPDINLAPPSPSNQHHFQNGNDSAASSPSPKPPSSFLFPMPPNPSRSRNTPPPSPIRGPRAPPPHRTSRRISKPVHGPSRDLRKSIMAIRRMNSEAGDLHPRQHSRYLSIGHSSALWDASSSSSSRALVGEVRVSGGNAGRGEISDVAVGGPKDRAMRADSGHAGSRTPERSEMGGEWGSPGRLYDPDGFLREE